MDKQPILSISVIIPCFNCANYLAEAVASVREQTVACHEIIIVDDGSTDNTPAVVSTLGDDIIYTRQDNHGPSSARNKGIEVATGQLVAFLDADDKWAANKLELQTSVLQHDPAIALVAADMAEFDAHDEIIVPSVLGKYDLHEHFSRLCGAPVPDALSLLMKTNFIPTGTVIVKRQVLLDTGGFNEEIHYGEDLELWAKIASAHSIACLPQVLMFRRKHGGNTSKATTALLRDLAKVATSVRKCCSGALLKQGVDPDLLVARAWSDLGYWHFTTGQPRLAHDAFRNSLREKFNLRAFIYGATCLVPKPLLYALRNIKQKLFKTD